MRIALFTTSFAPTVGGAEKQANLLADGLSRRGHQVVLFAPQAREGWTEPKRRYEVVRYVRLRSKTWLTRGWVSRLLGSLHAAKRFDVVHAHGVYPAAWLVARWCEKSGVPLVVRAYGGDILPGEETQQHWLRRLRTRKALQQAIVLLAQNSELGSLLAEASGASDRVIPLRNGVEVDLFAQDCKQVTEMRSRFGIYALTLSTFYKKKGLDVLLEAWAIVISHDFAKDCKLVICGHGPLEGQLKMQATRLGVNDSVIFLSGVNGEEKVALLQAARCYVSSARREPFSNAMLEALAAGCWLVATRTGGNIEIVQQSGRGELVPVEDAASLAKALCQSLQEDRCLHDRSSRMSAATPFSLELMLDNYEQEVLERCAVVGK